MPAATDRHLGIRASRSVRLQDLDFEHPSKRHGEPYQPTPPGVLDDMLLSVDADLSECTFVDLGCGKGRVLCHAAASGFARIIGVELAPQLAEIARQNVAEFGANRSGCRTIEVVCGDAASFALPSGPLVLYLFNPFRPPVLDRVVERVRSRPAQTWILYYQPAHADRFGDAIDLICSARDWSVLRCPGRNLDSTASSG